MVNFSFWSQKQQSIVRPSRYAGSWYESNASKLESELEEFLSAAAAAADTDSLRRLDFSNKEASGELLAVVVPHAGYIYSGATAAFAYKAATKAVKPRRIFLLGPSHHIAFQGAALPDAQFFATPLGNIEIDRELIAKLITYPGFGIQAEVHKVEHSLELQLPFLKHCFPEASLVPIVIGQLQSIAEARLLGEILKGFVGRGDLLVVSSDFTHYGPRYSYRPFANDSDPLSRVQKMDAEACRHLCDLDLNGFSDFLSRTGCTICGMFPCEVLLSLLPQASSGKLLKYASSRDSLGEDGENSVSYLAISFHGPGWPEDPQKLVSASELINLNERERAALLELARRTIEIFVKEARKPDLGELQIEISPAMKECFGVFVSLYKNDGANEGAAGRKELRGCIGSIYPTMPLYEAVQENAISAACRDHRFLPLTASELDGLELELNILTPPRRVKSAAEILVGRDGVILSKDGRQAVFLPMVAVEWGWSKEEMLSQLCLKAGLRPDAWRSGACFDVFQTEELA